MFKLGNIFRTNTKGASASTFSIRGDPGALHPYAGAAQDNSDIVDGMVHRATLRLRTPLHFLLRDGEVRSASDLPAEADARHEIWTPKLKSWRTMGINVDDAPEGKSSSDCGQVDRAAFLPFLITVRTAYERPAESDAAKMQAVKAVLRQPQHAKWVRKLGGQIATIAKLVKDSKQVGSDHPIKPTEAKGGSE